jgi:excisionase family DNA binding protein
MQTTQKNPLFADIFGVRSDLLTREEAAEYLGVTPRTLAVWACVGRYNLPYVKVGRLARYRKSDLDIFLTKRTVWVQSESEGGK